MNFLTHLKMRSHRLKWSGPVGFEQSRKIWRRFFVPFLVCANLSAGHISYREFEAAAHSIHCWGTLEKLIGPKEHLRPIAQLPPSSRSAILATAEISGRVFSHIVRLVNHESSAEKAFGFELAAAGTSVLNAIEPRRRSKIINIIGGEGVDPCLWWTYAPYLYQHLRSKGVASPIIFERLFQWAETGQSIEQGDYPDHLVHLRGLSAFNSFQDPTLAAYTLSPDPNHITHLFTSQESLRLIAEGSL